MVLIKRQVNVINNSNTELLDDSYSNLLKRISNNNFFININGYRLFHFIVTYMYLHITHNAQSNNNDVPVQLYFITLTHRFF